MIPKYKFMMVRVMLRKVLFFYLFSFFIGLSFHVDSVFALNWTDKEWINVGCPSSVLGKWVSEHDEANNEKSLVIKPSDRLTASGKDELLTIISSDGVNKASSTGNEYLNGDRFVEIMFIVIMVQKIILLI